MLYPTSSLFPLSGRGSWVGCSRTRCGCGSCPRGWPWRPGPTRPRSSRTLSHKCGVKMGNGSLSIFYQICWCTGHQIQSEKNSVKVKIFSNLCCPNLWGGSPVLLQFSLWNHLVDLKENKLIIWLMRAIMKFPICPFISFREVMSLSLQRLCCVWSRFSFLVREWKNVTDYCDYCDLVWVGAVGNIANPSPAPASYPII